MMIFSICPYCGHENKQRGIDPQIVSQNLVIYCDLEEGGCDQPYVALLRIKAEVTVRKIDGYSEPDKRITDGFTDEEERKFWDAASHPEPGIDFEE